MPADYPTRQWRGQPDKIRIDMVASPVLRQFHDEIRAAANRVGLSIGEFAL